MRTSGARSSPVRWRTSSARSALHLRRASSPASGSTRSRSPTPSRRRTGKDLSRRPGWRSCAPRRSAPTRPPTWTRSRATPISAASGGGDARQRELGEAWAAVVARKLKWKLIYQGHTDARDIPAAALSVTRGQFARQLRERLPAGQRDIVFEVDVAAQESRAFNPMTETADILFYEPLEDRYRHSRVLDLFQRLPVRMAWFRIFASDESHRQELIKAANEVLGLAP